MVKPIILPITYKSNPAGLRKAEKQLKNFAVGIGKVSLGATAAVAGIGAVSVKAFADFDAAMTQLWGMSPIRLEMICQMLHERLPKPQHFRHNKQGNHFSFWHLPV